MRARHFKFGTDPEDTARFKLATALLSVANEDRGDVEVLKKAALQRMVLDCRDTTPIYYELKRRGNSGFTTISLQLLVPMKACRVFCSRMNSQGALRPACLATSFDENSSLDPSRNINVATPRRFHGCPGRRRLGAFCPRVGRALSSGEVFWLGRGP
jgi:hypothetical protein